MVRAREVEWKDTPAGRCAGKFPAGAVVGAQPGEVWVKHYCSKAAVRGDVMSAAQV
jgi:hypothetical protein